MKKSAEIPKQKHSLLQGRGFQQKTEMTLTSRFASRISLDQLHTLCYPIPINTF